MFRDHRAVLSRLRDAGVIPLRRRPLRLCEMTADGDPWVGTVTTLEFPSMNEIQRRVSLAIWKSTFLWPSPQLLLMLPNEGTEKLVSDFFFRRDF
jgi:hypothetical protein